jgi:hypothetical protein
MPKMTNNTLQSPKIYQKITLKLKNNKKWPKMTYKCYISVTSSMGYKEKKWHVIKIWTLMITIKLRPLVCNLRSWNSKNQPLLLFVTAVSHVTELCYLLDRLLQFEEYYLLECNAIWSVESQPTFRKDNQETSVKQVASRAGPQGLCCVISQRTELYVTSAVRTLNTTYYIFLWYNIILAWFTGKRLSISTLTCSPIFEFVTP